MKETKSNLAYRLCSKMEMNKTDIKYCHIGLKQPHYQLYTYLNDKFTNHGVISWKKQKVI